MKFSIHFLCLAFLLSAHGVLARHAASPSTNTVSTKKASLRTPSLAFLTKRSIGSNAKSLDAIAIPRGGACSDSDPALFAKIGTTAIFESMALFGILWSSIQIAASKNYPTWVPRVMNQPLVELLASFLVIFGSSFVGAILDGGLSAATNQALKPNQVLGDPDWYANLSKPSWTPPGYFIAIMWVIVSKPTQLCALSRMLKFGINSDSKASLLALAVYTTHLAFGDVSIMLSHRIVLVSWLLLLLQFSFAFCFFVLLIAILILFFTIYTIFYYCYYSCGTQAWNKVFFGLECIGQGVPTITAMISALFYSAYLFYKIDKTAGYFMLPTCGWVTVATALQYSIYFRNKK